MTENSPSPAHRGRRAILEQLKRAGPQDAQSLAALQGVSAMAIRQHLYDLQAEGLVDFIEEPRPVGRPAKLWRLTAAANAFFPNGYADLTIGLIDAMKDVFGEAGMEKLLSKRARQQVADYRARLNPARSLKRKLEILAGLRTEEGYMAEVQTKGRDGYLLVENHCPICEAAATCTGLCAMELEVFQEALGDEVTVRRSDHILAGARRCAYEVKKAERA